MPSFPQCFAVVCDVGIPSLLIYFAIDDTRVINDKLEFLGTMLLLTHVPRDHISVGSIPRSGLLGCRVCVFTTLQGATHFVPNLSLHQPCIQAMHKKFHFNQSGGCEVVFHCGFHLQFSDF